MIERSPWRVLVAWECEVDTYSKAEATALQISGFLGHAPANKVDRSPFS